MHKPRWSPSAEQYTLIAIVISLCAAWLAAMIPALNFGSFQRMAAILISSDLVLYVLFKAGVVKASRAR